MSVLEKLKSVQGQIRAPKNQFNKFGGFKYRSCEDILEAVKPFLKSENAIIVLSDTTRIVGEVIFCDAEATFIDVLDGTNVKVSASAGIDIHRKGMDVAQSCGASSSYARKYALQGLLLLDDGADPDSDEPKEAEKSKVTGLRDYVDEVKRLDEAQEDKTVSQMREEMTKWFVRQYGADALLKFHEMTGGMFSSPDKIKTDKNVKVCYNKYLEYKRGEQCLAQTPNV